MPTEAKAALLLGATASAGRLYLSSSHSRLPPSSSLPLASGSGKSYSMSQLLPWMTQRFGAPARESYAYINPDLWISKLCDNNNTYRALANYCNHETFLTAVGQRRHLIFDATGRQLKNTCGRIIGRLERAGYRVHLVIVLASFSTCWHRIEQRCAGTGRGVPHVIFQETFLDLGGVVPTYLRGPSQGLCESAVLCNNDQSARASVVYERKVEEGVATSVALVKESTDEQVEKAIATAARLLTVDVSAAPA